ncbi:MAG TPA: dephospho-CoA kinase [Bacillota bacterium]|nr:dephospho-CoA kinase [Bacillota bacterium]
MAFFVGITGGIGTGKSTVCGFLRELGAEVIDADKVGKQILMPGKPAYFQVIERFGRGILAEDGTVDRKALGRIIFEDSAARRDLDAFTHPAIKDEVDVKFAEHAARGDCIVALEAPLLYEAGIENTVNEVWVVACGPEEQLERVMSRGFTRSEAEARITAQMPLWEKIRRADKVIVTDGSKDETRAQVAVLWQAVCGIKRPGERH